MNSESTSDDLEKVIHRVSDKTLEILARRKIRSEAIGGYTSLTVGPPGSGKTSHLLYEATKIMEWYPDELLFFRDSLLSAAQFNRIKNYTVLTEKGNELIFRDLLRGGKIEIPYKHFETFDDIINIDTRQGLAKPQNLNVIYFREDYRWIDFLQHLRRVIGWKTVFIDEIEDIIPLNPSKRVGEPKNIRNEKNIEFSNNAKNVRKGLVNLLCDTQSFDEIDWRFKRKLNFTVYLRGARVSRSSRIKQIVVDKLRIGECFIDWENRIYGKSLFDGFPPRRPVIEVLIT